MVSAKMYDQIFSEPCTGEFRHGLGEHMSNSPEISATLPDPIYKSVAVSLTDGERQKALVEWNNTAVEYPRDKTIHQLFESQVERIPEAEAVIFEDQQLTYRELNERANQLAHYLRKLGVGAETLVGLFMDRSAEYVIGVLGILKAGAAYVPLDPDYPVARLNFLLADSGVPVVLLNRPLPKDVSFNKIALVNLITDAVLIQACSKHNPANVSTAEHLAYVIYTSGSTGRPKGVAIPHRGVVRLVRGQNYAAFEGRQRFLLLASTSFDAATFELWGPLLNGAVCVVFPNQPLDFSHLETVVRQQKITCLWLTAGLFNQIIDARPTVLETVQQVLTGGEALSVPHVQKALTRLPHLRLTNGYGPTESTTFACSYDIKPGDSFVTGSVPIGRPLANTRAYILDGELEPVPVGVAGELHLGGDGLARGYLNRPELTAEKFIPDPFSAVPGARLYKTGDRARHRPDGNIEFLGRLDQQVKIRGFRIEPGEIEAVLSTHPQILNAAVAARADAAGAKTLAAYLVVRREPAPTATELREFLLRTLPDYMVPSAFVILPALPLTASGKVDRQALPAPAENRLGLGVAFVAPRTPTETALAKIWCDLLGLKQAGIHENFFALGGHSLLAVRMVFRIRDSLNAEVPVKLISEFPTIAELSQKIEEVGKTWKMKASLRRMQRPSPDSAACKFAAAFNQEQLWFLNQLAPDGSAYNVPLVLRLRGCLNRTALHRSLNHLIARHETLRTTFQAEDGTPWQIVAPQLTIELPMVNLEYLAEAEREMEVQRLRQQEAGRPFDLQRGPLVRAQLIGVNVGNYLLLLTIHHIVFDGWSTDVLLRELAAAYIAFDREITPQLPDLPVQFADFAIWQREYLKAETVAHHLVFWREHLLGVPTTLDFPTDRTHEAVQKSRGCALPFKLSSELTPALRELGRQHDATLFVTLLAAFHTLLHRYSRQEQILVGSPFAGRTSGEVENLIGFFVNSLPVKVDFSGNPRFLELLQQVRDTVWAVQSHQDLPFEQLVRELQPARETNRNPFFQVLVVLEVGPLEPCRTPGLTIEINEAVPPEAMFDLTLSLMDKGDELECELRYNADLFDDSTAARLVESYQILLAGILADPQQKVSKLPLLTEAARHQLVVEWNQTETASTNETCLQRLFEMQVEKTPTAVAVIFADQRLTYQELNRRANQLAHHLRTLGTSSNSPVGIRLQRSPKFIVSILGILKAGGAYLPLDPELPEERIRFMIRDAQAAIVISDSDLSGGPDHDYSKIIHLQSHAALISACSETDPAPANTPDDLAYVLYTSGSTGRPKGVQMPHGALLNLIHWQIRDSICHQDHRTLQFAPAGFDVCFQEIFSTLAAGGALVIPDHKTRKDFIALIDLINRENVSRIFLPFVALDNLAGVVSELGQAPLSLREVFTAGEQLRITPAIRKFFQHLNGARLVNQYGPTESHVVTTFELKNAPAEWPLLPPIGRPLANTRAYILDGELEPVPVGVAGELHLGGDGLARGYLNRPELTAEKFIPDPFSAVPGARLYKTGDRARHRPDGNIEFLGRLDQQVKIRGFRIEPGEIEAVLSTHPQILNAAVAARADAAGAKTLAAYLVVRREPAPTATELREFLLRTLPDYMVPSAFVILPALPLTASGKVDRQALPAPAENRLGLGVAFVAPRTPTETALAKIWCDLLGLKQAGIHENFFALGGHSLLAVRMVFRIRDSLNAEVPVRMVASSPTIAELGETVDDLLKQETAASVNRPVRLPRTGAFASGKFPVSFNQQQLWFLNQLEPDSSAYNMPLIFRLQGRLDREALEWSLNHLIARHEVLRTIFGTENGAPLQTVVPKLAIELRSVNLAVLPETDRETESRRLMREEASRPFDLSRSPLMRARLLCLDEESHVLLLTIHHIVFDGWSVDLLLRELTASYAARCAGILPDLPDLPIQYADFAVWQRNWLRNEVLAEQMAFWKRQLSGAVPGLELPTDHPRPSVQKYSGAQEMILLPKELADRLKKLTQQEEATLFMTFLTAFNVLLHRQAAQEDIIVGSPAINRSHAETEKLIGFFVNILVLRTDLSGNPTFRELLQRVRKVCMEAHRHQDMPFEKLVEELQPERRLDRNPLFQVMLNFLDLPEPDYDLPELKVELLAEREVQSKFDLTLYITPASQAIRLNLVYNADLFAPERIVEMLEQFKQLLEQVVDQPDEKIGRFNLVTPAAKTCLPDPTQPLRSEWSESVPARFSAQAQQTPHQVAVADLKNQWSYQELETRSNQLANYFCQHEIKTQDVVAIYGHRSASLVWALLGVWKAGAAFLILDPAHPAMRLIECLRTAKPKAWLQIAAAGPLPEELEEFAKDLKCRLKLPSRTEAAALNFLEKYPGDAPAISIGPDDPAYVAFTSGSTGIPKGIVGTHRPLSHFFEWHSSRFGLNKSDRFSMLSGLSHDPLLRDVFTPLWLGAALFIPEPGYDRDPELLRAWLKAEHVSVMHLAPSLAQMLAESANSERLPSLRHIFFGGEILRKQLAVKMRSVAPSATCVNFYGTTETPQAVGYYVLPAEVTGKGNSPETEQLEIIPVGKGIQDVQLLVLNSAGKLAGIGEMGEICVRTAYLAEGYLGNTALTRAQFPINSYTGQPGDRYYKTGDLGRYLPDGNIQLWGRNDAQVKIRGFRIELGEIETALAAHPDIVSAAVVVHEDGPGNNHLAAYMVSRSGTIPTAIELRAFLAKRLPDYMFPSAFVNLAKMPLTPNGKIDRKALPVPRQHQLVLAGERTAPRTPAELALAKIWCELLGVKQIGIHENFFASGGHSLLAVRMVNRINQQMKLELPIRTLFQHPTIQDLAHFLSVQKNRTHQPELIQLRPGHAGPELFFLIDEGSLGLFKLAHFLDEDLRLYASVVPLTEATLRASAKKQFSALPRLEDLAAEHAALIRSRQPAGPVLLAGHCFGGVLAFEVAHQLQSAGIKVEAVLMLDTWMTRTTFWWEKKAWLREHFGKFLRQGPQYLWRKSRRRLSLEKDELAARLNLAIHNNFNVYVPLTIITRIYRHAMKGYQPKPLPGRGMLFLSQDDWQANAYRPLDDSLGTSRFFTEGVTVINVPGNHVTILNETHLPELARRLEKSLAPFR
jgi:amino acid adenylation domain-containing protein